MWKSVLAVLLFLCTLPKLSGYAVLTHEALIDSAWSSDIRPLLLKRFPNATEDDLRKAHAYAYGGCIIQDMGYYPLASEFFSDLTHYVRSGDFVLALIRDSQDLTEYAFALGALAHYVADNTGHPLAVNRAVPIEYPKLRERFGNVVTYADDPKAHLKVEFGFDVQQVAEGHYAPKAYHDFIGFEVAQRLLECAFLETYGFRMNDIFTSIDLALGTYRHSVSTLLPEATKAAWELKKDEIRKERPGITRKKFIYQMSRASYRKEWGNRYERPGLFARVIAFLFRIIPKFGPFRGLDFRPPTPQTSTMFMNSVNETLSRYRELLKHVEAGTLRLPDRDMDTGRPTAPGEYRLADRAYAKLVEHLADKNFECVPPELRANVRHYFANPDQPLYIKHDKKSRHKLLEALAALSSNQSAGQGPACSGGTNGYQAFQGR